MVGCELEDYYPERQTEIGDVVFEVYNFSEDMFKDVSFDVRKGEILVFSDLMGAGRTEVMCAIFGLDKKYSGTVKVNGQEITITNPAQATRKVLAS